MQKNDELTKISPCILSEEERETNTKSLLQDLQSRCKAINQQDKEAWLRINSKEDWESFRNPRIDALKRSLGIFPSNEENPNVYVTGILEGGGGFKRYYLCAWVTIIVIRAFGRRAQLSFAIL